MNIHIASQPEVLPQDLILLIYGRWNGHVDLHAVSFSALGSGHLVSLFPLPSAASVVLFNKPPCVHYEHRLCLPPHKVLELIRGTGTEEVALAFSSILV